MKIRLSVFLVLIILLLNLCCEVIYSKSLEKHGSAVFDKDEDPDTLDKSVEIIFLMGPAAKRSVPSLTSLVKAKHSPKALRALASIGPISVDASEFFLTRICEQSDVKALQSELLDIFIWRAIEFRNSLSEGEQLSPELQASFKFCHSYFKTKKCKLTSKDHLRVFDLDDSSCEISGDSLENQLHEFSEYARNCPDFVTDRAAQIAKASTSDHTRAIRNRAILCLAVLTDQPDGQLAIALAELISDSDRTSAGLAAEQLSRLSDYFVEKFDLLSDSECQKAMKSIENAQRSLSRFDDLNGIRTDLEKRYRVLNGLKLSNGGASPIESTDSEDSGLIGKLFTVKDHFLHPTVIVLVLVYAMTIPVWFLLLIFNPLAIAKLHEFLHTHSKGLPEQIVTPLHFFTFLGVFEFHPRVLDAWVKANLVSATESFESRASVADRRIYIPTPVSIDGNSLPELQISDLKRCFSGNSTKILIYGEGGAGKSSLAFQIARSLLQQNNVLLGHSAIPIVLDQDFETGQPSPVINAVRGQLKAFTVEAPTEELVRQLLIKRRIVLIVDQFSELSEMTRAAIKPDSHDFAANCFIVTSRSAEEMGHLPKTKISPLRIRGDRLSNFLDAYLNNRGKRQLFADVEYFRACERITNLVGSRQITALLVKLYAELLISNKENLFAPELPNDIPELMLAYVNELNRSAKGHEPGDREVQDILKLVAWYCIKDNFAPRPAKRSNVLKALADCNLAESSLNYVEESLKLIRTTGTAKSDIRIDLDPLTDYLASIYVCEQFGENTQKWDSLIQDLSEHFRRNKSGDTGFLNALIDTIESMLSKLRISRIVLDRVNSIRYEVNGE